MAKKWASDDQNPERIGTIGENHFRQFASRHRLIPNKLEEDFGTDFICQVEGVYQGTGSAQVLGGLVGAFVRATESRRGRIRLNLVDVEHLLACDYPVFLILVHLKKDSPSVIHYKFVDDDFGEILANHVISGKKYQYLTPSNLNNESKFDDELIQALKPGYVEQTRVNLAAKRLNRVIPDIKIQIRRSQNGSFTLVKIRDFIKQFKDDISSKEHLYNALFGHEKLMTPRFENIPIQPELFNSLKQLPSPIVIGGTIPVKESLVKVETKTGVTKVCKFEVRNSPGYVGWVHQTGFALTASEAKKYKGQWVHWLRAKVDSDAPVDLSEYDDLWSFLEYCEPGATIQMGENDHKIRMEAFEGFAQYGFYAKYLRRVAKLYSWQRGTWLLKDAENEEILNTLAFLYHTDTKPEHMSKFGFAMSDTKWSELSVKAWVPICMNNKS